MKSMRPLKPYFAAMLGLFLTCFLPNLILGQTCSTQVLHLSGTETVGCTEVTVTSAGSAGTATICNKGPYLIGSTSPGSYTFSFSPAVTGVRLGVYAINNFTWGREEVAVSIDGSFYPLPTPGIPDNCLDPTVLSGTGTLQACLECVSSCDDIEITETINSITIEDVYISGAPFGVSFYLYICCPPCPTDAGRIFTEAITLCPNEVATVPPTTQPFLENDDVLQYILFADLNDTLGSVLATSNTPQFNFNSATMQYGTTYHIAAIAGNNVGGNVSFSDPCISISNEITVVWNLLPTVSFSSASPNLCAGECSDITATFTGLAPFTLSYTIAGSAPITQIFLENTSTFQVCVPANAPPGNFSVQAVELVDKACTCN